MHNLFEFFFELLGPGFVVRAHYSAYIPGAIADGRMREHVIDCQFPFHLFGLGWGVDGVAPRD